MPHIMIIGGGISGLAAAIRIRETLPHATITILESASKPGGQVGTIDRDGFRVERGPNGLFDAKPNGVQLCRDLGLGEQLIAGSEESRMTRFLFVNDRIQKLPGSPLGILTTSTLSIRGRLSLLCEPFRKKRTSETDESIASFASRRFGKEAASTFIDGLVTGIYAGDPERLSLKACLPRLTAYEADAGSVIRGVLKARKRKRVEALANGQPPPGPQQLWSFRGGLKVMIDAMSSQLSDTIVCGINVKRIERVANQWVLHGEGRETWTADVIVLTCPAYRQAEMLADLDPVLADDLASISYNRIAVVALGYRREQVTGPQNGFGYIAPQNLGRDVLGVQWCSSVFPDRAPQGFVLWRALCGGIRRADIADLPNEELLRTVHREMQITTGVTGEPVFSEIVRWPKAIPQYEMGHLERVTRIEKASVQFPGLILGGNALRGVSVSDCAEQGENISNLISNYLANPLPTS